MEVCYRNIQSKISDRISESKETIQVAVAWFTNKELLSYLTEKAVNGVKVQILISDDVINKRLNFTKFNDAGGELQISAGERFLHEKFGVFDGKKVITGTYNWTYGAEYRNHESIVISDYEKLVQGYSIRFKNLWNLAQQFNVDSLIKKASGGFEEQEDQFKKLEKELEDQILKTLDELTSLKVPIDRTIVLDMIHAYGAIGTCRKVLEKGNDDSKIPSGFKKLAEAKRINQSFEYFMTREKYRVLFPEKILTLAEERLKKFSY